MSTGKQQTSFAPLPPWCPLAEKNQRLPQGRKRVVAHKRGGDDFTPSREDGIGMGV